MSAPKFVVLAVGPSAMGKTRAMEDLFLSHQPRRLSVDFQDEMQSFNSRCVRVFSLSELRDALRKAASFDRWHIALVIDPETSADVFPQLARLLHPPRTAESRPSYGEAVGGVALDCTEADYFVPNGRAAPEVRSLFQRGRHSWLQLYMTTQSPALIDPRARDASDVFLAFRSQEDTVWRFWQRVTSAPVADCITELPVYWCAYVHKATQTVYVLDARRRVVRVLDYQGASLPARSMPRRSLGGM